MRPLLARGVAFARKEALVVAAVALLALLAGGFLQIADEVAEGETAGIDRAILLALREHGGPNDPIGPDWLALWAVDLTSLGSVAVLTLIVLAVSGLFLSIGHRRQAAVLIVASVGGAIWTTALKGLFDRARPEEMFRVVEVLNASFPSGHAMSSAAIYLTLGALCAGFSKKKRVRAFCLGAAVLATVLVGLTRVYLGVHWASDVAAGWCLGGAWAAVCWLALWVWDRGWKVRGETPPVGEGRQ